MKKLILSLALSLALAVPALAGSYEERVENCDWWGGFVEAVATDRLGGKPMKTALDQAVAIMANLGVDRDITVTVVSAIYQAPLNRSIPRHQAAGDIRNTFYAGCMSDYGYDER